MRSGQRITFGPFSIDTESETLWRGAEQIALRPRALSVLRELIARHGRVVTKSELIKKVWAGTSVSDTVLKVCVREIREALGEAADRPQFIETVPRRGYRFISDVDGVDASVETQAPAGFSSIVGRQRELAQLERWLGAAEGGIRKVVFVTGEPGIGKTTLVDLFIDRSNVIDRMRVGRGQCLERYGEGEPYLPVLEALGRLCRETGGHELVGILRRYAPAWLVHMPSLVDDAEFEILQRKVQGTTRERMLREVTEAIEAYAAERGLVLVLEDLQWSDYSTLELISYLAHRRERVRLMVVGTYRPGEVAVREHPLEGIKEELNVKGQCEEIEVQLLTEDEVVDYVHKRLGGATVPTELGRLIHRRTDGNPMFVVNLVDYAARQGLLDAGKNGASLSDLEQRVPDSLRRMIEKQIEALSGEARPILEVASVAGWEFSAAAVAAGAKASVEEVETQCDLLASREHLLRSRDVEQWPDGTVSARYAFIHGLYQHVLYEQMGEARRVRIHRLIAERKEQAYGDHARAIAGELSLHFEWGRDQRRAVRYHRQAGENAAKRCAYREAVDHLRRGLALLEAVPESDERLREELMLQTTLGGTLTPLYGAASEEVEAAYARAEELCKQTDDPPELFPVLFGLLGSYQVQAKPQKARALGERILRAAAAAPDPTARQHAHLGLGNVDLWSGELSAARRHFEQSAAACDEPMSSCATPYPFDAGMRALSSLAVALALQGHLDQALVRTQEALSLAEQNGSPFDRASNLIFAALVHQIRQDQAATRTSVDEAMTLATEQGFALFHAAAAFFRGWVLSEAGDVEDGITLMHDGVDQWRETGARIMQAYFCSLIAEACRGAGRIDQGLVLIADAMSDPDVCGGAYEAELHRLQGELLRAGGPTQGSGKKGRTVSIRRARDEREPEACFLDALEIARGQGAKTLELRAATSLARLRQSHGRIDEARAPLSEIHSWFSEGLDTPDLRRAAALLSELHPKRAKS